MQNFQNQKLPVDYLKEDSYLILDSIADVLDQLDENSYSKPLEVLSGSSISQHTRHILEFYMELLQGLQKELIDYDARKRSLLIESNKQFALNELNNIHLEIKNLEQSELIDFPPAPIQVKVSTHEPSIRFKLESSIWRELAYCNEHTIHHLALIKIAIKLHFPEVRLPIGFGVAFSTQFAMAKS